MSLKILMYHNVSIPPKEAYLKSLYTKPSLFEKQIKLLKILGYKTLDLKGLSSFLQSKINGRFVMFSFDDAYVDIFENALPILKKYGFGAIIFVPAGLVGEYNKWDYHVVKVKKQIASWSDIEYALKEGFEIGSHTITHPVLTKLDVKSQKREIEHSKKLLEDKLGIEINSICYPYGNYDKSVLNITKDSGYSFGFSVDMGKIRAFDNPYKLKRIHMRHNTNRFRLLLKLSKLYD